MTLYDKNTERIYTMTDLYNDWKQFKAEDPANHANDFTTELFEILMATINYRNDCDILNLTPTEISNYIFSLRDRIERRI